MSKVNVGADVRVIGITGGIGAGKSVVSRLLMLSGHPVYDCDLMARLLMDSDVSLPADVAANLGEECVGPDGRICRHAVAARVFADDEARLWLNSRVHGMVGEDFRRFRLSCAPSCGVVFVEAAVLKSSGLWRECDMIWIVSAPEHIRVERVCRRNGLSPEEVRSRIRSQEGEFRFEDVVSPSCVRNIVNDGLRPLVPQVEEGLSVLTGDDSTK